MMPSKYARARLLSVNIVVVSLNNVLSIFYAACFAVMLIHLVSQQNCERQRKSKNKEGKHNKKLPKRFQDVCEHHDENSKSGNFLDKQEQTHPG